MQSGIIKKPTDKLNCNSENIGQKRTETEEIKGKVSKMKEMIKLTADINEIKKQISNREISKAKTCIF